MVKTRWVLLGSLLWASTALAQEQTVSPSTETPPSYDDCTRMMQERIQAEQADIDAQAEELQKPDAFLPVTIAAKTDVKVTSVTVEMSPDATGLQPTVKVQADVSPTSDLQPTMPPRERACKGMYGIDIPH